MIRCYRYVLCGGTDPPVLLEQTRHGVKSILTAAKAEVFKVPGRPTAPWPVHGGAHAMYVVYSVRNGKMPVGPNPFAAMRVPWQQSWWDPHLQSELQAPGADINALAADRLRYGSPFSFIDRNLEFVRKQE